MIWVKEAEARIGYLADWKPANGVEMRIKTILQFVDPSDKNRHLEDALELAQTNDLHLRVVVVGIAPDGPATLYTAYALRGWGERREKAVRDIEKAVEDIEQLLQEKGVSGDVAHYLCEERDLAALAGIHARYVDLPLWRPNGQSDTWHRNLLAGLIFQSGRPLMAVPGDMRPSIDPKCVVVGWNGRLEAVRAVHASLDLLAAAERVAVVMVDPSFGQWGNGQEPGFDIGGMLARHGIRTEIIRMGSNGREPGMLLREKAREIDADLIVMGAYGHSRLQEWVFGGTSRHMLTEGDFPIVMMH